MGQRFRVKGVDEDLGRHEVLEANEILSAKPSIIMFQDSYNQSNLIGYNFIIIVVEVCT